MFQKLRLGVNRVGPLFLFQGENVTEEEILRWKDMEADRDVQDTIVEDDLDKYGHSSGDELYECG